MIRQSMIRKSGNRFSEKIMLNQRDEIMMSSSYNRIMNYRDLFGETCDSAR